MSLRNVMKQQKADNNFRELCSVVVYNDFMLSKIYNINQIMYAFESINNCDRGAAMKMEKPRTKMLHVYWRHQVHVTCWISHRGCVSSCRRNFRLPRFFLCFSFFLFLGCLQCRALDTQMLYAPFDAVQYKGLKFWTSSVYLNIIYQNSSWVFPIKCSNFRVKFKL